MDDFNFVDKKALEDIFRQGRFKPKPTLCVPMMSATADSPPEAVVTDAEGQCLGCCWQSDLEHLLQLAKDEGDTALSNPNITVVYYVVEDMKQSRESCARMAADIARQHAETVVQFNPV